KIKEGVWGRKPGGRSCRIREQGLNPKIQDQHLPGKIFAKLPDSLAPELLQLLTPEFFLFVLSAWSRCGGRADWASAGPRVIRYNLHAHPMMIHHRTTMFGCLKSRVTGPGRDERCDER